MSPAPAAVKGIGTLTFFGMTVALVATVRNVPDLAATGWVMFFYMFVATFLFALPLTLMSGEFAGMFPKAGGPELWVTNSLGERWGFMASWLLWVQMFPGMVMVAAAIAPLMATTLGRPDLASSSGFTLVCILVTYWAVSLLNLRFDMARVGGRIGVALGVYLPVIVMFLLGLAAFIKVGLRSNGYLGGDVNPHSAFRVGGVGRALTPFTPETASTLALFAGVVFIYIGIEMSSVYIPRLANPVKTYLKGIFLALGFMFLFNVVLAFLTANVVPAGKMDLNNIAQAPVIFLEILGLPTWIGQVFALLVLIGIVVQLSAWVTGPSKTITSSARRGLYPPGLRFWKTNKFDVAPTVVLTQATLISVFALVFLLVPSVNTAFLMLVTSTTFLYIIVYVLMSIGVLRLRSTQPDHPRPFRMGGKPLAWAVVAVFLVTAVLSSAATLWFQGAVGAGFISVIVFVLTVIPLLIYRVHKPAWKEGVEQQLQA